MNLSFSKIFMISAVLSVILLSGCNTAEGIGKDIENAGQKIQDTF